MVIIWIKEYGEDQQLCQRLSTQFTLADYFSQTLFPSSFKLMKFRHLFYLRRFPQKSLIQEAVDVGLLIRQVTSSGDDSNSTLNTTETSTIPLTCEPEA